MVLRVLAELLCSTAYPPGLLYDPNMSEARELKHKSPYERI